LETLERYGLARKILKNTDNDKEEEEDEDEDETPSGPTSS
jgi:hypothetical protein